MGKDKIIIKLQARDEEAFDIVYNKYVKLVYHVIFSIVENREDTKDLVQDTFIKMMDVIDNFNPRNNFKYWLLQIGRNKAIDFIRKRKRIKQGYDFSNIVYEDKGKKKANDFYIMLSKYEKIITKDEFDIITLHLFHELKFREIALLYNNTTSAVNNIYYRGIKKIRNYQKGAKNNEKD